MTALRVLSAEFAHETNTFSTIPTGYGYGGWGCLDYFVEQPGRYTFTEAFLANHHALVQRLHDPATDARTRQRLRGDLDVVAINSIATAGMTAVCHTTAWWPNSSIDHSLSTTWYR